MASFQNGEANANPMAGEKINTDIVTLTRFLTEEQTKHKEATGDFTYVFSWLSYCVSAFYTLISLPWLLASFSSLDILVNVFPLQSRTLTSAHYVASSA